MAIPSFKPGWRDQQWMVKEREGKSTRYCATLAVVKALKGLRAKNAVSGGLVF
jgi:hypothetical protein